MKNREVAHCWAHQNKPEARGSNFYFYGSKIYSYGCHFMAGRIVEIDGKKAYLINASSYSSTTAKHMLYVRSSIPRGAMLFMTNYVEQNGSYHHIEDVLKEIHEHALTFKNRRSEGVGVEGIVNKLTEYIQFFKMDSLKKIARYDNQTSTSKIRDISCKKILKAITKHGSVTSLIVDEIVGEGTWGKYQERLEKAKKRIRLQKEREMLGFEEKIALWKKGEKVHIPHIHNYLYKTIQNTWLRIKDGFVETSKGISVPIEECKKFWTYVKALHAGRMFQHNIIKDRSGQGWRIDRYENDTLVAGCHTIPYSEMESIAKGLGLTA